MSYHTLSHDTLALLTRTTACRFLCATGRERTYLPLLLLERLGIYRLIDLVNYDEETFSRMSGVGRKIIAVKEMLAFFQLDFALHIPPTIAELARETRHEQYSSPRDAARSAIRHRLRTRQEYALYYHLDCRLPSSLRRAWPGEITSYADFLALAS